ncbi:MAG: hypothetical protein AAFU53_09015 [Cyanobacteria bacterium J06632_3]
MHNLRFHHNTLLAQRTEALWESRASVSLGDFYQLAPISNPGAERRCDLQILMRPVKGPLVTHLW